MTVDEEQVLEIQNRLDELAEQDFSDHYLPEGEARTQYFQDIFVQLLNFDETPSELGDTMWQDLPVNEWTKDAKARSARLFAKAGTFRVVYVELEKMTRIAERNVIQNLTASERTSGWARDGAFLSIFHDPDEDVWHLVTPYEEESDDITDGRPVLRRYTLGRGEKHRTVSEGLAKMDASQSGVLSTRVYEAFRVKPVTENFYNDYKDAFDTLTSELRRKGFEIEDADRYAHMTLNRLMFFYYLQKKGWIGGRKEFIRWFHQQYQDSDDQNVFHEKWLTALFFDGMNQPEGREIKADLPVNVESAIAGIPHMNGGLFQPTEEDQRDTFLSDSVLDSVIHGFLEQYNFTVTEESPYDIDVAVDPAMLGKIYESLIAREERDDAGIFYTPRTEVDVMCRVALVEQLRESIDGAEAQDQHRIIEFVFSESSNWQFDSEAETSKFRQVLEEIDIVDPACGSGAFLVGMLQVLTEAYKKLGDDINYSVKENIINNNLYGVEIKDWAVRVAEFRLWLSLMEGEDDIPPERPVLPNFDLNLQIGDSIVQKIGGEWVSIDVARGSGDTAIQGRLDELKELETAYFEGSNVSKAEVQESRRDLIKAHIDNLIDNATTDGEQVTFSGESIDEQENTENLDIERLRAAKDKLNSAVEEGAIIWELAFPEVMIKGGFDIVIGNPPYLSGSEIVDQSYSQERLELMDDDVVEDIEQRYRDDLEAYVERTFDLSIDQTSDYYLYFFFRGIDIAKPGGTVALITSNTWLDVDYGETLQEGLLTLTELRYVFENRAVRSFVDADVNTAITVANRHKNEDRALISAPSFISFVQPYSEVFTPKWAKKFFTNPSSSGKSGTDIVDELADTIQQSNKEEQDDQFTSDTIQLRGELLHRLQTPVGRRVSAGADALWRFGGGETTEAKTLDGNKFVEPLKSYEKEEWGGLFIRAPDILYEVLDECGDMFTTLTDDEVEMYLKTGADKFFFVNKIEDVGDELVQIENREYGDEFVVENEFVEPLIKSSSQLSDIRITDDDFTDIRVVVIPPDTDISQYQIQDYVEYGEEKEYDEMWRTSRQDPWWKPAPRSLEGAPLILPRTHNDNHRVFYNPERYITNRFYRATVDDEQAKFFATMLNSTFSSIFFEVFGKVGLGGGALSTYKPSYRKLPIVSAEHITDEDIPDAATEMFEREIESLFKELGAKGPEKITLSSVKDDRRELDQFVMGEVLGLTEEQQVAVYQGALRLVKQRIEKSESV